MRLDLALGVGQDRRDRFVDAWYIRARGEVLNILDPGGDDDRGIALVEHGLDVIVPQFLASGPIGPGPQALLQDLPEIFLGRNVPGEHLPALHGLFCVLSAKNSWNFRKKVPAMAFSSDVFPENSEVTGPRPLCWFTGLRLDRNLKARHPCFKTLAHARTKEHLIPQSSRILTSLPMAVRRRNIVPASALVNTCAGSAPLGVKLLLRDRLQGYVAALGLGHNEHLSEDGALSLRDEVRSFMKSWELAGQPIWFEGRVNTETKRSKRKDVPNVAYFSTQNPWVPITDDVLDERNRRLKDLAEIEQAFLLEHFGVDLVEESLREEPAAPAPTMGM